MENKLTQSDFEKIYKYYGNDDVTFWKFLYSIKAVYDMSSQEREKYEKNPNGVINVVERYKEKPYKLPDNLFHYLSPKAFLIVFGKAVMSLLYGHFQQHCTKAHENLTLANAYLELIDGKYIQPFDTPKDKNGFISILTTVLKHPERYVQEIAGSLFKIMLGNPNEFSEEQQKLYFSVFAETYTNISPQASQNLLNVRDHFRDKDFRAFFEDFRVIRKFYNENLGGISKVKLHSFLYEVDVGQVAREINVKIPKTIYLFQEASNFLEKLSGWHPDIQKYHYFCDKRIATLQVAYLPDSLIGEQFCEKVEMFIDCLKNQPISDKDNFESIWGKVEGYYPLQKNLTVKTTKTKTKKI